MPSELGESAAFVAICSSAPFVHGVSPAMLALERVIANIAPTDIPILLVGESGTGKEVMALEVHRRSLVSNGAFLKCNCPGLVPESLNIHLGIGAEVTARSGTIFFDDVSQLDAANQSRLLQLLSEAETPTGSCLRDRVISSTTRSLEEEMRAGRFREELYYRISGVCLRLPSLRQRQEDIPLLFDCFLKKYVSVFARPEPRLTSATMEFLRQHSWPGNIRELENFARKLVVLGDEQLALYDLVFGSAPNVNEASGPPIVGRDSSRIQPLKVAAREASRKAEHELILKSLERTHWNRKRTARELQISYKALLYKLKQLDLDGAGDSAQQSDKRIAIPEVSKDVP
jgi:two-component system, NtrC family, response regulator AtoC